MMVLVMAVYLMPVESKAMEKIVRITDLHKHCLEPLRPLSLKFEFK